MKNKLTRKLMLSAFTLLFAVISLGASTYAWFVMSEDAKVNAFTGTVTAGESGLEIQVTAVTVESPSKDKWRSTELNLAQDFADATKVVFDALQNNNGVNKFSPDAFAGLNDTAEKETDKINENYVAFRLWFRLADVTGIPATGEKVYLTDYDLTTEGDVNDWYVNKEYQNTLYDESKPELNKVAVGQEGVKYYVSDAARIAFYNKVEKEIDGQKSMEENVNQVYEAETLRGDEGFKSWGIGNKGALSYYNAVSKTPITCPANEKYYSAENGSDVVKEIGTLTTDNNLCYVDVYVWIEGWDQECINAIFNQTLKIVLKFSINNTPQEAE